MSKLHIESEATVTCDRVPIVELLTELAKRFPEIVRQAASRVFVYDPETRSTELARAEAELKEAIKTRDRTRALMLGTEQQLEEVEIERDRLLDQVNELTTSLAARTWGTPDPYRVPDRRPSLPEGMRLADHKHYGRVVVSPGTDIRGYYMIFALDDDTLYKADYWYAKPSDLTFLDEEPASAPAPLPRPEDCKPGEFYLVEVDGYQFFGTRRDRRDKDFPWSVGSFGWHSDSKITILGRFELDRPVDYEA